MVVVATVVAFALLAAVVAAAVALALLDGVVVTATELGVVGLGVDSIEYCINKLFNRAFDSRMR